MLTDADEANALLNLGRFNVVGLNADFLTSAALILAAIAERSPESIAKVRSAFSAAKNSCNKGAGGWEAKMCREGERRDKSTKYAHMKKVFLGTVPPASAKEKEALAAGLASNARDRRVYQAAIQIHCSHLAKRPDLFGQQWVHEELRAAGLCEVNATGQ